MTQVSSINNPDISLENKKGRFFSKAVMHNARQNIIQNLKLIIVLFVLHIAGAPLVLMSLICQIPVYGRNFDTDVYMSIAAISTALGAAGGIICALSIFSYLYKKSDVDMRLGLPMTTAQRFVSDFLSGLFVYVMPFLAAQILTWILMLIGHLTLDGKTFTDTSSPIYQSETSLNHVFSEWECNIFSETAPMLWRGILGGILLMLMFYVVTVLVTACCGNIFECVAYNILLNVLVPLMLYLICAVIADKAVCIDLERMLNKPMALCSPGGGVFGLVMALQDCVDSFEDYFIATVPESYYSFGKWCVLFLLVTAVLGAAAYLIYRLRRAEDTGKPVVFGVFYHIIMILSVFCISYAFMINDDYDNIIPMIIITALLYMIFHVVRNRGFSRIVRGIVSYAVTLGVCIGSYAVIDTTQGFHAGSYVPDPSDIKSVTLPYAGVFASQHWGYINRDNFNTVLTDADNIAAITDIHKSCVQNLGNSDDYSARTTNMEIAYTMKSGRTVFRNIELDESSIASLAAMDMTEEMRQIRADYAAALVLESERNFENYTGSNYDPALAAQWRLILGEKDIDGFVSVPLRGLPDDFGEKLCDALRADILNETAEEYYTPEGNIYQLDLISNSIMIKDSYRETIAYLRSCGFDPLPENSEKIAEKFISNGMEIKMNSYPLQKYMSGEENITAYISEAPFNLHDRFDSADGKYTYVSISGYTQAHSYNTNTAPDPALSADLSRLLSVSKKMYISDEISYTIIVDGRRAAIPVQYNELAERVFIRMTAEYFADITYNTSVYGDPEANNIFFLRSFTEFYGRDKIQSALEYYYGSLASDICGAMFDFAAQYSE